MWIETVSPIALGIIVFSTQVGFIFSRTLNVIYTAERNIIGSLFTGVFIHLFWLVSIAIGVKSVMQLDYFVILCSLIGGLLGTYLGIKLKKRLEK